MADDHPLIISRRDLLKGAAIAGVAMASPVVPAAFDNLTVAEGRVLDAIVARLIPTDANGPGATEALAARYIDRALGGALAASKEAYRVGLAAIDRYSRASKGKPFVDLAPAEQDAVLVDVEAGTATSEAGFASSAAFFTMVKAHTWQGTFGDPHYGGNANFVGWELIGYPGVRTVVTAADQQRLEKGELKPNRRSAYDYNMFIKTHDD